MAISQIMASFMGHNNINNIKIYSAHTSVDHKKVWSFSFCLLPFNTLKLYWRMVEKFGGVYVRHVIVSILSLPTSWSQIFEESLKINGETLRFHIFQEVK